MGGAVCVRACPILQEKRYKVAGVAVLDVVEGSLFHSGYEEDLKYSSRLCIRSFTYHDGPPRLATRWI